jgi:cell division protease FtsH
MCSHLVVTMGGRAAEKLVLDGDYTQGASSDIAAATTHATRMVCDYGMSELGTIRIDPDRLTGEDAAHVRSVIAALIAEAEARADHLVAEHRTLLERMADRLLEKETLSREELRLLRDEDRLQDLTTAPPV